MSDLINGKTPEEIKRWIDSRVRCDECTNNHEVGCEPEERTKDCQMCIDTLALIERLEAERDAALAKVQKWISVEERLPEPFVSVLVQMPGEEPHPTVREGFITHDGIWFAGHFKRDPDEVTHWMPLPEPPKEK